MYITNSKDPRIAPWGTSRFNVLKLGKKLLVTLYKCASTSHFLFLEHCEM